MKDIPTIEPKEIITTITNMKTGEVYKDDSEWKATVSNGTERHTEAKTIMRQAVHASGFILFHRWPSHAAKTGKKD